MGPTLANERRSGSTLVADPTATTAPGRTEARVTEPLYVGYFGSRDHVSEVDVRASVAKLSPHAIVVTGGCLGPKPKACWPCNGSGFGPRAIDCPACDGTGKEPQRLVAADWYAIKAALERGLGVLIFPADFERLGDSAGPIRNHLVVKYSAMGRGFRALGRSVGTEDTRTKYRRARKPCRVTPSDVRRTT